MSKSIQTQPVGKTWSTPRLNRLGTIADVAANSNVIIAQSTSRS